MKTLQTTSLIRTTLLAVAVVSAMSLPLIASASSSQVNIGFDRTELESPQGQKRLYAKMKNASRQLCGSTNIQITGSVAKSAGYNSCYSGTLTAAVERLDNDAITALHTQ